MRARSAVVLVAISSVSTGCSWPERAGHGAVKGAVDAARGGEIEELGAEATDGAFDSIVRQAEDPARREQVTRAVGTLATETARQVSLSVDLEAARAGLETTARRVAAGAADEVLGRRDEAARTARQVGEALGEALASSAVRGFSEQIRQQLGEEGEGPLARAIQATTERTWAASVRGGRKAALAPLTSGELAWIEEIAHRISLGAAKGATVGVEAEVDPWHYVLAFTAGVVAALVLAAVVRVIARRRETAGEPGPGRARPQAA